MHLSIISFCSYTHNTPFIHAHARSPSARPRQVTVMHTHHIHYYTCFIHCFICFIHLFSHASIPTWSYPCIISLCSYMHNTPLCTLTRIHPSLGLGYCHPHAPHSLLYVSHWLLYTHHIYYYTCTYYSIIHSRPCHPHNAPHSFIKTTILGTILTSMHAQPRHTSMYNYFLSRIAHILVGTFAHFSCLYARTLSPLLPAAVPRRHSIAAASQLRQKTLFDRWCCRRINNFR